MKYYATLILILIMSVNLFAQKGNGKDVQILLKGNVSDEFTGQPVSATMEFRESNNGKRFKIQSNSADGYYQQVLNAGTQYDLVFTNNDIVRKIVPVKVDNSEKYTEQIQDFKVKKLTVGLKYFKLNAFEPGSAELKADALAEIESLKEVMQFNRAVSFEFVVNAHDTYKKEIIKSEHPKAKPDKKKSKKKNVTEIKPVFTSPSPDLAKELSDKRLTSVNSMLSSWTRFSLRLTSSADFSVAEPEGEAYSLYVVVKEIKNLFEK